MACYELVGKFLQKFFLIRKVVYLRREITDGGRNFYEACKSFKILIQKCPRQGFPKWMRLQVGCKCMIWTRRSSNRSPYE
ncbi:hypothetical protein EPI10_015837 [Gossypium australe]|uniref:Uncharacterized protein n=1 Tax=Gossypium australe TaxID=47621 RepID=A0A5B6VLW1_9ROSI|nr:hypothetical protein EPI10_015837 [Gossypium australe]